MYFKLPTHWKKDHISDFNSMENSVSISKGNRQQLQDSYSIRCRHGMQVANENNLLKFFPGLARRELRRSIRDILHANRLTLKLSATRSRGCPRHKSILNKYSNIEYLLCTACKLICGESFQFHVGLVYVLDICGG